MTKNIVFTPDPKSLWKSPKTGVTYPLAWTIDFPKRKQTLFIKATVKEQEMPILGPGGGIWEGSCTVRFLDVSHVNVFQPNPHRRTYVALGPITDEHGVAYMELVGYNSPAVKARVKSAPTPPSAPLPLRKGRGATHYSPVRL